MDRSNALYMFQVPISLFRSYVSPSAKIEIPENLPGSFTEIMTGLMVGDGSLRMHGNHALLSVQQKHQEFVAYLWDICKGYQIVTKMWEVLTRLDIRTNTTTQMAYFQTFTLPFCY